MIYIQSKFVTKTTFKHILNLLKFYTMNFFNLKIFFVSTNIVFSIFFHRVLLHQVFHCFLFLFFLLVALFFSANSLLRVEVTTFFILLDIWFRTINFTFFFCFIFRDLHDNLFDMHSS